MSTRHRLHLAVAALAVCPVLIAGLAACDTAHENDDEQHAATGTLTDEVPEGAVAGTEWLEGQLTDGVLYNEQYQVNDYSTTVELAYALGAVDSDDGNLSVEPDISAALEAGVEEYAMPGKDAYAGALGKLASYASDIGADPTDFGGVDLVAALEDRTADSGSATGRISDESQYGDYANAFGQAWAVRGLTLAVSGEAAAARDFLLLQQCADGYFRQDFSAPDADDQSCDGADADPSTDATALVVVLLEDIAADDDELSAALDAAVDWLVQQQADNGSYVGSSQLPTNSDSTGLAGWALQLAGEDDAAAAAAAWVLAHQVPEGCDGKVADAAGAIAYDDDALSAAASQGITVKSSYQWRLATVQALPALLATPLDAEPAPCPVS